MSYRALGDVLLTLADLSVAFSLVFFVVKRQRMHHKWLFLVFSLFFACTGASRWVRVFGSPTSANLLDAVAGVMAAFAAVLVWPVVVSAIGMPSMEELEQKNKQLVDNEATARSQTNEISALNAELENRLKALNKANDELKILSDRAMEALNAKSAFVANISHELRTPLSGIIGMNELLLDTELNVEQRSFATTVQQSAELLLTIVNDLLDLAKLEAGKIVFEEVPFDLREVIDESLRLISTGAKNKGLFVKVNIAEDMPEAVVGDPVRVRQILLNLLSNAVKFTETGGIVMTAELSDADDKRASIYFSVEDTGIGMTPEESANIFRPFTQADVSSTRRYGGTGLGLTICKRYVELMGGRIGFSSVKDRGSKFWFELPLEKAVRPQLKPKERAPFRPPEPSGAKILLVEDNPTLQLLVQRQLKRLGLQSVSAANGMEALSAVEKGKYDVILMDLHMPVLDGFKAATAIRDIEGENAHTPIIAMTGSVMASDIAACRAAGMDDFLGKPVSLEQLKQKLEAWLPYSYSRKTG